MWERMCFCRTLGLAHGRPQYEHTYFPGFGGLRSRRDDVTVATGAGAGPSGGSWLGWGRGRWRGEGEEGGAPPEGPGVSISCHPPAPDSAPAADEVDAAGCRSCLGWRWGWWRPWGGRLGGGASADWPEGSAGGGGACLPGPSPPADWLRWAFIEGGGGGFLMGVRLPGSAT